MRPEDSDRSLPNRFRQDEARLDEARLDEDLRELHRAERDASSEEALSDVRQRLLAAARDERAGARPVAVVPGADVLRGPGRARPPRTARRWWPAATAAAAVTALAVVLPLVLVTGPERVPQAGTSTGDAADTAGAGPEFEGSARELLHRAADAVRDAPPVHHGRSLRVTRREYLSQRSPFDGELYTYGQPRLWEIHVPASRDEAGRGEWSLEQRPLGPSEWIGARPGAESAPELFGTTSGVLCGVAAPSEDVCHGTALWYRSSTYGPVVDGEGGERLLERLRDLAVNAVRDIPPGTVALWSARPRDLWETAGMALRSGGVPAPARARIYRELADTPGVEVTQRRVRMEDRAGVAVGIRESGQRREIIIDPETGAFVGTRTVAEAHPAWPDIAPGTVLESATVSVATGSGGGSG